MGQGARVANTVSLLRKEWGLAFPRCANPGCNTAHAVWPRPWRQRAGIQMAGNWYCTPECLEAAMVLAFTSMLNSQPMPRSVRHRVPLGLLMVSRGLLSQEQLQSALNAQRAAGHGKIGEWLEKLGYSTEEQVTAALGFQWACPVLVPRSSAPSACTSMLPLRLLESCRLLPVHYVAARRVLYIGFGELLDYTLLRTIGQMLDCRTEACLLRPSLFANLLEQLSQVPKSYEITFDAFTDPEEMARITRSYVCRVHAEEARTALFGEYVWIRLSTQGEFQDLLFRRSCATSSLSA